MNTKEAQQQLMEATKNSNLYLGVGNSNGRIVIGRGNIDNPEYLFLQETPTLNEVKFGGSYIGKSTTPFNLFEMWVKECNIANYAVINAVPIIPLDDSGSIRKPSKEELDYFRPHIRDLIESINPKHIICLGKTALDCIQKEIKLSEWVGNIGFMYHPSYFLRQGKDGLQQFKMLMNAKDKVEFKCDKILVNTRELFETFIKTINKDVFAFDTETTDINIQKLKLCGISFCDGKNSWYLPFGHITQESQLDLEDYNCPYDCELTELFYNAKLVIGHNLVFDMQVLKKYNIYPENVPWFDTMVAQHLIDEESEKGLKFLSKYYFGHTMETYSEVSKNENFANVKIENAKNYSCDDSIQTFRLYELLTKKIEELDLHKLFYDIEIPFLRCIIDMEQNGILIDKERIETLKIELRHKLKEIETEIVGHLPSKYKSKGLFGSDMMNINLNSTKQLSQLLFDDLKLTVKEKSDKTGNASVGIPALKQIINEHLIIKPLLKYKEYQKLSTAFLEALPKHIESDGRIHCNFNPVGTVSGRLCLAKGIKIKTTHRKFPIENLCDENKLMEFIDIKNKFLIVHSKEGKRLIDKSIYKGIQKTITITVEGNRKIEGTYDHLIYDGFNFLKMEDIKIGDVLPIYTPKLIGYKKIIKKEFSENKVYDIKILTKQELENYYNELPSRSIKSIAKNFGIKDKQAYTLFKWYGIKTKPFSLTSNRELLRGQKLENNPMSGKTGNLHHNYGRKFDGTKHSIARKKFIKLNPVKYISPITNKLVDWLTYNRHNNKINHNTTEYKTTSSNRQKRWFSIEENKKKFDEAMSKVPQEIRKEASSKGGQANALRMRTDPEFKKIVGAKITKARTGHIVTEETKQKIRIKNTGFKVRESTKQILREYAIQQQKDMTPEEKKEIIRKIVLANTGQKRDMETRIRFSAAQQGIDLKDWKGFISCEPYNYEFNDELKEQIRKRDKYTCQVCGETQKQLKYILPIHHIDYNKKNSNPNNLITLCRKHHSKTNYNREKWKEYFRIKRIMRGDIDV